MSLARDLRELAAGMLIENEPNAALFRRWLETLTITMVAPLLGLAIDRADPFLIHASFPWLVLVPLLCGAQHGLVAGLVSNAVLSVLAIGYGLRGAGLPHGFTGWFGGCLMVSAIAGQLRDVQQRRAALLAQQCQQLTAQLERVQRSRAVLKLSHARLQERLSAERWSLDAAMEDAARRMARLSTPSELGHVLLEVLANQALVQAASLYGAHPDGALSGVPIASLGDRPLPGEPHPLVKRAFAQRRLAAVIDPAAPGAHADRSVLVAVPLITATQRMVGVVAVHQMPFMAFQADQLQNILLLASQLTDQLADRLGVLAPLAERDTARNQALAALKPPPPLGREADEPNAAPKRNLATTDDSVTEVSVGWEPVV